MMIKRVCAMLLALVMCTGVFSTTAFAYSNETVSAADVTEATEPEETESAEEQPKESEDELPYNFTITEDGTIVFSFNGEEYEYDMDSEESQTTGKVVTGGSRLNVRIKSKNEGVSGMLRGRYSQSQNHFLRLSRGIMDSDKNRHRNFLCRFRHV